MSEEDRVARAVEALVEDRRRSRRNWQIGLGILAAIGLVAAVGTAYDMAERDRSATQQRAMSGYFAAEEARQALQRRD